ncbi:MAG: hypothetical protein ACYDA4_02670 [Ignavibacteriaceae bacterium]
MINEGKVSIWFFIGSLLTIYGIIIFSISVYDLFYPVTGPRVVDYNLHAGIWWGALLLIIGIFYIVFFRPGRVK